MEIHQVVVAASPGDAVTDAAFGFQELLQKIGPSGLFAHYIDPRLERQVVPLSVYDTCGHPDDVLIYHLSIGEPDVAEFLLGRQERLVLVYHNITPPEYYRKLDPGFASLLAVGRAELARLRDRTVLALAVSAYNAQELEALGFPDVRVSPLPVNVAALAAKKPDPIVEADLAGLEGPLVVFVGQLLPHKRPDLLIQAYHVLSSYLRPEANLALLGRSRSDRYLRALQTQALELNLHRARIPGWLTGEALAAYYRRADLFVTMSEHEGVCVPLLEAMSFDVPVIARDYGAIRETLGSAGLLLPAGEDPFLVAEAMAELLESDSLRRDFVTMGRERVGQFSVEAARSTFLANLASIV